MSAIGALVGALERGDAAAEALARAGEGEPARALAAFARARARPELAAAFSRWAPDVLRSARPAFAVELLVALAEAAADGGRARVGVPRFPSPPTGLRHSG